MGFLQEQLILLTAEQSSSLQVSLCNFKCLIHKIPFHILKEEDSLRRLLSKAILWGMRCRQREGPHECLSVCLSLPSPPALSVSVSWALYFLTLPFFFSNFLEVGKGQKRSKWKFPRISPQCSSWDGVWATGDWERERWSQPWRENCWADGLV